LWFEWQVQTGWEVENGGRELKDCYSVHLNCKKTNSQKKCHNTKSSELCMTIDIRCRSLVVNSFRELEGEEIESSRGELSISFRI